MMIKLGVVLALGAPALAVLIFEVLLNATSMFNPNFAHVLTEASEKTLYSPLWRSCNLPDFH
jgi:hypothetical protein